MNLDEHWRNLISIARMNPPDDRVPYAFEKRVMARLRAFTPFDLWGFWAWALWRATAPCVAIALLLAAWNLFAPPITPPPGNGNGSFDVAQEFENTVLAAAEQDSEFTR